MSLKIATLNIEHGRHLPDLFRFVKDEQPDVLCLQEVFEVDLEEIWSKTSYQGYFSPYAIVLESNGYPIDPRGVWGQVVAYNPPRIDRLRENQPIFSEHYYVGSLASLPEFTHPEIPCRVLQVMSIKVSDQNYRIGNTHFTWSANGQASRLQHESFNRLARFLDQYPELILCGDFNAPRGGEIFELFTKRFTDNIPPEISTTIDSSRHYSGKKLDLVVDNIFTNHGYLAKNVRVISGVSDHCAVVGDVEIKKRTFGPLKDQFFINEDFDDTDEEIERLFYDSSSPADSKTANTLSKSELDRGTM